MSAVRGGDVLLACLAIAAMLVLVVLLTPGADAAAVAGTCANVVRDNAGLGARTWYVGVGTNAGVACSTSTDAILEANSGDTFTLKCRESTTGTPPDAAETLTIYVVDDEGDFGLSTTSARTVRTIGVSGASCTTEQSYTLACTSNGDTTGAARYGVLRVAVRATRTSVPAYDVDSDTEGNWGLLRCNPRLTAFTDALTTTGAGPATYVGGDTLRTTSTVDAAAYKTGTNTRADLTCATKTTSPGSVQLGTGGVTIDQQIKGRPDEWPDDCTLIQKLTITRKSAISGLTDQDYARWDTSTPISGVTYTGQEAARTAKPLDRTTPITGTCQVTVGVEPCVERARRGETVTITLTVKNARGEDLPSGRLVRAYLQRATQPAYDTTDAPLADPTVGSAGATSWNARLDPGADGTGATHTNDTVALDYNVQLRSYGASRTDAELYGWANSTNLLDVSKLFSGAVNTWKGSCTGTQTGVFILASEDVVAQTEGAWRDARGNTVTASLSVTRTYRNPDYGTDLGDDSATTTTGTTSCHTKSPAPPASANWRFGATATDADGNSGTAESTITFLAAYTNPYQLAAIGSGVPTAPGKTMPIQVRALKLAATTGLLEPYAPDQVPRYRVNYTDANGAWQTLTEPTACSADTPSARTYWCNVTIPADWPPGRPAVFQAWTNMSGLFVPTRADLVILEPRPDDPLTAWAADVVTGSTARVYALSRSDNGTSRLGAGTNISVYVVAPDGSLALAGVNPTEVLSPRIGYYYADLTASQEGAYTILVTARTSLNEIRSSPPAGFTALPRPANATTLDAVHAGVQYGNSRWNTTYTAPDNDAVRDARDAARYGTNLGWNVTWPGEFRPARDRLNATALEASVLPATEFRDWKTGESRPAWAQINATNSVAGDALRKSDFEAWRDGEARPWRGNDNASARETTLAAHNTSMHDDHIGTADSLAAHNTTSAAAASLTDVRSILIDHGRATNDAHDNQTVHFIGIQGDLGEFDARLDLAEHYAPHAGAALAGLILLGALIARAPRAPAPPHTPTRGGGRL